MGELYLQNEYAVAVFQLVFAMLGMGATLTVGNFKEILLEPKAVTSGGLIQLLMVPIVIYLFINGFAVAGGVAVGLALLAAVPGGTVSNIFTHFARGNVALSIAITAITTAICLITTPIILDLFVANYVPDDFVMPRAQIMVEIALSLLLPLLAGMIYLHFFPGSAPTFSKWCIRASLFGILVIVAGSLSSGRLDITAFGFGNLAIMILLIIVLGLASMLICRIMKLPSFDASAINIEITVRNVNLAIVLKASLFPAVVGVKDPIGDMVLFTLLVYGSIQLILAALYIYWRRGKLH